MHSNWNLEELSGMNGHLETKIFLGRYLSLLTLRLSDWSKLIQMFLNPLTDSKFLESISGFRVLESTNGFNNDIFQQNTKNESATGGQLPNYSFESKYCADSFKPSPGQLPRFQTEPTSWGRGRIVDMWYNWIIIINLKINYVNTGGKVDSLRHPLKCRYWTDHGWPSASNCIALLKNIFPGHLFHLEWFEPKQTEIEERSLTKNAFNAPKLGKGAWSEIAI